MKRTVAIAALVVIVNVSGLAEEKAGNVPMTNPGLVLATHEQNFGHSVNFLELADGRILMSAGEEFRVSNDGGMSWSEPYRGKNEDGQTLDLGSMSALVRLSGNSIGAAHARPTPGRSTTREWETLFRRSDDAGKTWSAPVVMNPRGPTGVCLQDVFVRTASGRIVLPVYLGMGQPGSPRASSQEGAPIVGAYLNGIFVTTNAHFYDPAFGASYVFYSDDEGKTWRRNKDGELFVVLAPGGQMEPTFEPSLTEVSPGKLLMIMRTRLGRYFQAWSYNNGETWTRPQATQLAGTHAPAQVRTFKNTGHLLCVFTQQSPDEIRRGFVRTRLSCAISRNGGRLWEHFQNVYSLHEETHIEPGPLAIVHPEGGYSLREGPAFENDSRYVQALPEGWGYFDYPSVLMLKDRVLISYAYSWYDKNAVVRRGNRMHVFPIKWFYGGRDPFENPDLEKWKQP